MKTALACAMALAIGGVASAQVSHHMGLLSKDFKKVYVISNPTYIYPPFDVEFYTVATSMAHQAAIDEAAKSYGSTPYFTVGLKSFDVDAARTLYDYYEDSPLWARYDWHEAQLALNTNLNMMGLGWVNTSIQ